MRQVFRQSNYLKTVAYSSNFSDFAGGPAGLEEDEDDDEETGGTTGPGSRAQYVSANCVVFTHSSGDVASVVDEHFSRALSYAENKSNSSTSSQIKGKSLLQKSHCDQKILCSLRTKIQRTYVT
jgi:hypothetical protein